MPLIQWIYRGYPPQPAGGDGQADLILRGQIALENVSVEIRTAFLSSLTSPASIENRDLSAGDNIIVPPFGATAMILIPPSNNTSAVTVKGTPTDTGISWASSRWLMVAIDPSVPFVYVSVSVAGTFELVWV